MKRTLLFSQGESGGPNGKRPLGALLEKEPAQTLKLLKMLHVEDEPQIARAILRMAGKVVNTSGIVHAEDGKKALEILEKNTDFDLILLDLRMPNMGGIAVIRRLMEAGKQDLLNKIVVTSGTLQDILGPETADVLGAIGGRVLGKPIESEDITGPLKMVAEGWGITFSFEDIRK